MFGTILIAIGIIIFLVILVSIGMFISVMFLLTAKQDSNNRRRDNNL